MSIFLVANKTIVVRLTSIIQVSAALASETVVRTRFLCLYVHYRAGLLISNSVVPWSCLGTGLLDEEQYQDVAGNGCCPGG